MGKDVIRAVVADDDAGMRLVMRKLIERQEEYELVGEYPSGEALMAEFEDIAPDVCVLDVEMPGLT
ncbi:MAG: response regulator, partial [Candidatus Fimadaptatus sp.]|nr:response regulator [Candidatus Fimadaptatus sp.]